MTAFCSPLKEVFNGRPRAAYNETNNRGFAKKLKESSYHTLLNQGQLAACVFTRWWWRNGQKKFTMILRGFRTDLFTKTFALGLCSGGGVTSGHTSHIKPALNVS